MNKYTAEERIRAGMCAEINSEPKTDDKTIERARLEAKYGQVWDTEQLQKDFEVQGFMAPFVGVRRKSDGKKGAIMFQHHPRFYFNFNGD